ncbi:C4-dicarboxylate transporter, anaerobic [Vibrio mimicus VM603]|uniref:C4-dicarboxylate transporter, anaerobic n=1 Tax=Vibrio mimicus VM603 TaxID=671074 RepID=D2YC81_VIBMI|nr:C4-dicarboxylate transporter, anaerobic [Vibrio mimicus VM603]
MVATVNFDNTGTTKVVKWYFNHSFMSIGLIAVISTYCMGFVLSKIIIG